MFMAIKADFFGDGIALAKLQASDLSPKDCKALGRGVEGFNESTWCKARVRVMDEVLAAKFEQNPSLAKMLSDTGQSNLIETSPYDEVWGAGMGARDILSGGR